MQRKRIATAPCGASGWRIQKIQIGAEMDLIRLTSFGTCLACGLGHAAALTAHRAVIHYRVGAFGTPEGKAGSARFIGDGT